MYYDHILLGHKGGLYIQVSLYLGKICSLYAILTYIEMFIGPT